MQLDFVHPFGFDILKGGGRDDREHDQEDVCIGVCQWPQLIVIFLSYLKKQKVNKKIKEDNFLIQKLICIVDHFG